MKKLKLTINGEVKTFDLPENGEYKCEVEETYVPKAGDCVMVKPTDHGTLYWCKLTSVTTRCADFKLLENNKLEISKKGFFNINKDRTYTKITPDELKAKYAEAGYDWDYASDTITSIKWVPKHGDEAWFLNNLFKSWKLIFEGNGGFEKDLLDKGLLFQTEEDCQKFADHCMSYFENRNK